MSFEQSNNTDRRSAARFTIVREVRYKILSRHRSVEQTGFGNTNNMSSSGVLFTTDHSLRPGVRLEVSISWPAELNGKVPLKLVARGSVVRSTEAMASHRNPASGVSYAASGRYGLRSILLTGS